MSFYEKNKPKSIVNYGGIWFSSTILLILIVEISVIFSIEIKEILENIGKFLALPVFFGVIYAYNETVKRDNISINNAICNNYFKHKDEFSKHCAAQRDLFDGIDIGKIYTKFYPNVLRGEYSVNLKLFSDFSEKINEEVVFIYHKYNDCVRGDFGAMLQLANNSFEYRAKIIETIPLLNDLGLVNRTDDISNIPVRAKKIVKQCVDFYTHDVNYALLDKISRELDDFKSCIDGMDCFKNDLRNICNDKLIIFLDEYVEVGDSHEVANLFGHLIERALEFESKDFLREIEQQLEASNNEFKHCVKFFLDLSLK